MNNEQETNEVPVELQNIKTDEFMEFLTNFPAAAISDLSDDISIQHLHHCPDLEEIDANANFEVKIKDINGSECLYSEKLNKIYIKMGKTLGAEISHDSTESNLYLRVMLLYSATKERHHPVIRCMNHRPQHDSSMAPHILHCLLPDTVYVGSDAGLNFIDRLAVYVELGKSSHKIPVVIPLQFMCQNSCSSGMSRRETVLIFTLETKNARILGKRIIKIRVASVPRRDMEKEEEEKPSHKRIAANVHHKIKKSTGFVIKQDPYMTDKSSDDSEGTAIRMTLKIPQSLCAHILECAYYVTLAASQQSNAKDIKKYADDIKNLQNAIKHS